MGREYILKVNEEQARVLSLATELLARVGMGQWRDVMNYLPLKKDLDYSEYHDDVDQIGELISKHTISGVNGYQTSLGISNEQTPERSKIAFDLYQVIRQDIAWNRAVDDGVIASKTDERKWPEMLAVTYDNPMVVSNQPLPEISSK